MIHLVYPHRDRISAPDVIGRTLLDRLGVDHEIRAHDFDRTYRIDPAPGDVLIGHAHPIAHTVFRRSMRHPGWSRRILLEPFNADWRQVGFIDDVIDQCDLFLAITGRYWFERTDGPTARWKPKMVHVDLAVDQTKFPLLRTSVADRGHRRILYIGNDHPGKNLPYLDAIAGAWRNGTIDWAGRGKPLQHVTSLGFVDFSTAAGRELISRYDFLITVGNADANPTTVLEAMSWGLVPICTSTSGYCDEPGIINVPPDDVVATCTLLDQLQHAPDAEIEALRAAARQRLDTHFRWDRLVGQVRDAISSDAAPPLAPRTVTSSRSAPTALMKLIIRNLLYRVEQHFPRLGVHGGAIARLRGWFRR